MISRRVALKLGAASLIAPTLGMSGTLYARNLPAATPVPDARATVPMYRGNSARTGVMPGPMPSLDMPIVIKWRYHTGWRFVPPEIMVEKGTIFFHAGDEFVHALDAVTGETRWQFYSGHSMGTVCVDQGSVYVGGDTSIFALNAATGSVLWEQATDGYGLNDPIAVDGAVLVRGNDGPFRALDPATGMERWRFTSAVNFGSPSVGHGTAFFASDHHLFAVDVATGAEIWRFAAENDRGTPVVGENLVFLRSTDGHLYGVDIATGIEHWRYATEPSPREFCFANGTVYLGSNTIGLFAVDAETGTERWRFLTGAYSGTPVVVGQCVYIGASPFAFAIDADTGEEVQRIEVGSYASSEPTVIDGVVYVATHDEYLYCLANPLPPTLRRDAEVYAAPSVGSMAHGTVAAGTGIDSVGENAVSNGDSWVRVTIGDLSGWIQLDAIEPASLPAGEDAEEVYAP